MPTLEETAARDAGIAPVRVEAPEPTHRPHCFNRPPYMVASIGEWLPRQGAHEERRYMLGLTAVKPRYRWRDWFSTDRCRAWDCAPTETPAPVRDRWDCRGCRWLPARGRVQYGE